MVRHESELSESTTSPSAGVRRMPHDQGGGRRAGERLVHRGLHPRRAAHAGASSGCPRSGRLNTAYDGQFGILTLAEVDRAGPPPVDGGPPDPGPRRAQAHRGGGPPRSADGRARQRRAAPAGRDRSRGLGGPAVLRRRDPARPARPTGGRRPADAQPVRDAADGDGLVTRAGLRGVSTYAQAIGPSRERVLLSAVGQDLPGKAPLVHEAHRAELAVYCWTLRAENAFLPEHLRRGKSRMPSETWSPTPCAPLTSASTA